MGRGSIVGAVPSRVISATLAAGLLVGCGGADPAADEPAATPAQTTESAATGYSMEQVESALRAVESVSTTPSVNVEPSPGPDTFYEQYFDMLLSEAVVEPAECATPYRERIQYVRDTLQTPRASVTADDGRLRVDVKVFPRAQTARDAGRVGVEPTSEPCLEYTVTARMDVRRKDESSRRTTITPYTVHLPETAEQVTAATVELHEFDVPRPYTRRDSLVSAVAGNVLITTGYGDSETPGLPVLAERAAAERAARQVITELTGSR